MIKEGKELIGLSEAARIAGVTRWTIVQWEQKGWLSFEKEIVPRKLGRPGKLYKRKDVINLAKKRGRNPEILLKKS